MDNPHLAAPTVQYQPKETYEELLQHVETYRTLIAAANIGAWEYFIKSGLLNCNAIYFSMLGRDIADYQRTGMSNLKDAWHELIHPEDAETAKKTFEDYLTSPAGKMYESFFRLKHEDGSWVWVWSRGRLMESEGGKEARIIGTHIDVTSYKQAEQEIMRDRILLRTLIENLPDQIYLKDADSRFLLCNTPVALNAGFKSPDDIIGKTDFDFYPEEAAHFFDDEQTLMKAGLSLINQEEQIIDKETNEVKWNLSTKVPFKDNTGKVVGLLGINRDITRMKSAVLEREEIMKNLVERNADLQETSNMLSEQSEELQSLNEQLTEQKEHELEKAIAQGKFEIASEVLHDIGNALVGFGSYLNRINRAQEKNNLETVKSLAVFIKTQEPQIATAIGPDKAAALTSITEGIAKTHYENKTDIDTSIHGLVNIITHIQEILNIQRQLVRGHGGVHERKPVNLANVIEDCKAMLLASFDKKNILLTTEIKPGKHVIKGDHTKLMQVILNVLKNSLEAIDYDLPEKKVSILLEENAEGIELKITDNGQGFASETAEHFFERGFTTKKSGTGLGLYNCKLIVESHGGTFEITSEGKNLGAQTAIKFPIL